MCFVGDIGRGNVDAVIAPGADFQIGRAGQESHSVVVLKILTVWNGMMDRMNVVRDKQPVHWAGFLMKFAGVGWDMTGQFVAIDHPQLER